MAMNRAAMRGMDKGLCEGTSRMGHTSRVGVAPGLLAGAGGAVGPLLPPHSAPAVGSTQCEDHFHLHRRAFGQRSNPDRHSGVLACRSERLCEDAGCRVDNDGLIDEV